MIRSYLIDNNSHSILEFRSKKKLKEYAKTNNIKIKPSPLSDNSYYTESYIILPTGYKD